MGGGGVLNELHNPELGKITIGLIEGKLGKTIMICGLLCPIKVES